MQLRVYANPVSKVRIVERWIHPARRWVLIERGGTDGVCTTQDHEAIKGDVERFRRLPLSGFQDAGDGLRAELRTCQGNGCGSTIAIFVDQAGAPCEGPK